MPVTTTDPFRVDDDYDRDYASDGISRYGAYLRAQAHEFADCDDAGDFAALAWKIATGPIMAPGYVRRGWPRVQGVSFGYHEDGLLTRVEIDAPLPVELAKLSGYRSWEVEDGAYWEPTRFPALLATVTSLHVIPRELIPAVADPTRPDTRVAKDVVRSLVFRLNEHLQPIMAAIGSA